MSTEGVINIIFVVALCAVILFRSGLLAKIATSRRKTTSTTTPPPSPTPTTPAPTHNQPKKKLRSGWWWFMQAAATTLVTMVVFCGGLLCWSLYKWVTEKPVAHYHTTSTATTTPVAVATQYPISGGGFATREVGLKAYLDPRRSYLRPRVSATSTTPAPARYVFVKNPSIFFDDVGPGIGHNKEIWREKPAGEYLVYPLGVDQIYFRWWQR